MVNAALEDFKFWAKRLKAEEGIDYDAKGP